MLRTFSLLALSFGLACGGDDDSGMVDAGPADTGGAADAGTDTGGAVDAGTDAGLACDAEEVVTFETEDGVTLEAFLQLAGPDAPVAALFHMIPPGNSRANYRPDFRNMLVEQGWAVLNVDRRGAGGSGGDARDAYEGPGGARDVQAAVAYLATTGCVDLDRLVLFGASNGTTSVIDGTVAGVDPAGIVLLSGGGYTENQNRLADVRERLDPIPIAFLWAADDAPAHTWNIAIEGAAPSANWNFDVFAGAAHGTQLLSEELPLGVVFSFLAER